VFVESGVVVRKLLFRMKSYILVSYWCVGSMTMEFPLSALDTIASFCSVCSGLILSFFLLGVFCGRGYLV